jgi:hypothetical protein
MVLYIHMITICNNITQNMALNTQNTVLI